MHVPWADLVPEAAAFGLALIVTPLVGGLARRWRIVARPQSDRWHKQPTALLGGVAIFLSSAAVLFTLGAPDSRLFRILAAGSVVFGVGLVDDLKRIKPLHKLLGQIAAAGLLLWGENAPAWTGCHYVDLAIALFWLVGITNAVNLLDNMDGLAPGTAVLAALFMAWQFLLVEKTREAQWLGVVGAALGGFLVYNFKPAAIFMGDCGSLPVGFFLAGMAMELVSTVPGERNWASAGVPICVLIVPIFDTTLVTILRTRAGRSIFQGGRDHASHRLVAPGLTEPRAVGILYGWSVAGGFVALGLAGLSPAVSLPLAAGFVVALLLFGVYLSRVKIYDNPGIPSQRTR
jgi:UDP-GlcNAc:undecaprenyl-phosphate GlcNAc-1-phosphate transferase